MAKYTLYPKSLIDKMYDVRIGGMPASFFLLDLRKTKTQSHISSSILSYIIENSHKMTGESSFISGLNKSHSWVEDDHYAYETTEGLVWDKSSYYEKEKPEFIEEISKGDVIKSIRELLDKEVSYDMMIAFMKDMRMNLFYKPYEKELEEHIARFIDEKNLDIGRFDGEIISYMQDLRKAYSEINDYADKQDDLAFETLFRR